MVISQCVVCVSFIFHKCVKHENLKMYNNKLYQMFAVFNKGISNLEVNMVNLRKEMENLSDKKLGEGKL